MRQAAKIKNPVAKPVNSMAAPQKMVEINKMSDFDLNVLVTKGTPNWAHIPTMLNAAKNQPSVVVFTLSVSILKTWKPITMVNCAIVKKKLVTMAVPITGRVNMDGNDNIAP